VGHVAALDPTSAGRCGPKLQLVWQHVDARHLLVLTYSLYVGVPGLQGADRGPWAHLRRRYEPASGDFSTPHSVILIFLLGSRRRTHHQRENIDGGPSRGAGAEGPGAPTINVKMSTVSPREVPELKVRELPPST
jgi:hypothetical protein